MVASKDNKQKKEMVRNIPEPMQAINIPLDLYDVLRTTIDTENKIVSALKNNTKRITEEAIRSAFDEIIDSIDLLIVDHIEQAIRNNDPRLEICKH